MFSMVKVCSVIICQLMSIADFNSILYFISRYAITLWYFDKEEREAEYQRLKVARERQVYVTSHEFKN